MVTVTGQGDNQTFTRRKKVKSYLHRLHMMGQFKRVGFIASVVLVAPKGLEFNARTTTGLQVQYKKQMTCLNFSIGGHLT